HMGGIRVETDMSTDVAGLYAAGEAVGGANGANRLSGNAITEAVAFGMQAGRSASTHAGQVSGLEVARALELAAPMLAQLQSRPEQSNGANVAGLIVRLQALMHDYVGPFRTEEGLQYALEELAVLKEELGDTLPGDGGPQDPVRLDALDLRNMLLVAEAVTRSALSRR